MRYLTKEWYEICQQTDLHFGMRVHKDVVRREEDLYWRLYKRKEKEFIKWQRIIHDHDPRFILEKEGMIFIPLDKFISGDEIKEEDEMVYHIQDEERSHINQLIEEYDSRLPFDVDKCKIEFKKIQEIKIDETIKNLPKEIYSQIADPRVFALGYCTKEIKSQLKMISKASEKQMKYVFHEYDKAQENENIPEELRKRFGFHDCRVIHVEVGKDIIFNLDTTGGFTKNNKIIFHDATVMKQEKPLVGSLWLYEELYRTSTGYEAHMLFVEDIQEVTIRCNEISIDKD